MAATGGMRVVRTGLAALAALVLAGLSSFAPAAERVPGDALALRSPPVLRHYDVADGLPQSSTNALLRTRDGFLWIATFGGLARFDGHEFRTFPLNGGDAGPASRRVVSLYEDAQRRLWIGTEDAGISVYAGGRFRHLPLCGSCQVQRLFSVDGRDVWALTAKGMFRIDPERLQATRVDANGRYHLEARIGVQVLVGGVSGLQRQAGDGFQPVPLPAGHRQVSSMAAAGDAAWLILDGRDLYRFDIAVDRWTRIRGDLKWEARVLSDGAGGLYLSDDIQGVRRLAHDGAEMPLAGAERLYAVGMVGDADRALWLGTPGKGLWLLRSSRVDLLRSTAVPDAPGRVLAADGAGGAWLAISCFGLWHRDAAGRQTAWPIAPGILEGCIHSLQYDADTGALWIGTTGGSLARLVDGRLVPIAAWPQAGQVGVWRMRNGRFWVANLGFVGRLRFAGNGTLEAVEGIPELAGMDVKRIVDARAGGVWVVGDRGAFRVVGNAVVERWTAAQGIDGGFLRALHEDADGVLWLGSYGNGLFRIERGQVRRYTEANGLFDDTVSCILPGPDGRLWLASNRGISVLLDRNPGTGMPAMHTLTNDDGLDPSEFNGSTVPPCIDDGAGHLWFAMMAGFARVTPARLRDWAGTTVPRAYIDRAAMPQSQLDVSAPIQLGVNAANLEIRYGAIDLLNSGKVRFRYRVAGLGKEAGAWIDAGDNRSLLLPAVPWGRLTFEVQARELGGAWSRSATLQLNRPLPWYRYHWIWMAVSLASLLALLWLPRKWEDADVGDASLARLRQRGVEPRR